MAPVPTEPLTPTAPRPVRRTVFRQQWRDLTFLHWAVDPERVRPLLPRGVRPDVLDGVTYVGLVPFLMRDIALSSAPALPYFGSFPETNVRLYSVDDAGRRGVTFRSLEATRLATVLAARALAVPYCWARMRATSDGRDLTYTTTRRWPGPVGASSRVVVRPGAAITEPSEVERFLTARWGLHGSWAGTTFYWPNEHDEWPLRRAELLDLDDELIAGAGLPEVSDRPPDSVLFSHGVSVLFGPRSGIPG
ncbi:MAG: YqjF family protein [Nocardioides sp.]